MRAVTRYRGQNLSFAYPDHLCFDRTMYDNINGLGGPFMLDIVGPARPLMYPDQISHDSTLRVVWVWVALRQYAQVFCCFL